MEKPTTLFRGFWYKPRSELLELLQATPVKVTSGEAQPRLRFYGPNNMVKQSRFAPLISLLRFLINPLVIILLVARSISLVLGDPVGGGIIIAMVLLSVLLNFRMEFQVQHAVEEIRKQVATMKALIVILFVLVSAGLPFSGYLSGVNLFSGTCAFNEACPYFLGYPRGPFKFKATHFCNRTFGLSA